MYNFPKLQFSKSNLLTTTVSLVLSMHAIFSAITFPDTGNASVIIALEHIGGARLIGTVLLVGVVTTVKVLVTFPVHGYTSFCVTWPPLVSTGSRCGI